MNNQNSEPMRMSLLLPQVWFDDSKNPNSLTTEITETVISSNVMLEEVKSKKKNYTKITKK